jgi:ABC-type glycerol-3-phosphate transport system permease component
LVGDGAGLDDTLLGLAIIHTTIQLPFSFYIMRNAFEAVPRELEEAAFVDGAPPSRCCGGCRCRPLFRR